MIRTLILWIRIIQVFDEGKVTSFQLMVLSPRTPSANDNGSNVVIEVKIKSLKMHAASDLKTSFEVWF